jgi:PAS domain S-box-containing protein
MITIPLYRQFRFKLVAVYILLVVVVIVVSGLFSYQASEKQFRQLLFQEFQSTRNVTNNFLKFVEQTTLIAARSVAADEELLDILLVEGAEPLALRLAGLMKKNSVDIITLLNHEGRVIARGHDPKSSGDSLLAFDLVADLRRGKETVTAIVQDQESFILYSTAVLSHPQTGKPVYVLAGNALNNNFVDHIQENSHIEVSLVRERSLISTTFRSNNRRILTLPIPFLEYEILLANPGRVMEAHFLGQDYLLSAERLPLMQKNMAGSMLLSHSLEELTAVNKDLAVRFVSIFISSFLVGVVVILFFTGKMLRPIQQLILSTKQISTGDLQSRVTLASKDEFNLLGNYFNAMADSIQERDSALKLYNRNLKQQVEERTKKIVEQSVLITNVLRSSKDLAIVITDMDLQIKYFNPVAEIIFSQKAEDVFGHTIVEIHQKESVLYKSFEKAMAAVKVKGVYHFTFSRPYKEKMFHIEATATAIADENEVVNGFVLMARDVTSRLEMERRVLESRKAEGFSVLAGGLAHDFNNLLQVILGGISYARILTGKDPELAPVLADIEEASQQTAQLSRAMLTLSKGGFLVKEPFDLKSVLQKKSAEAHSATIHCETDFTEDLLLINGNEDLLQDAFRNIFENALDAMTEGGFLTVSAKIFEENQGSDRPLFRCKRVEIKVSDTGIGISSQNIDQIFDPYFSTKARGTRKGVGLGLATTQAIINKHGGQIIVQSEEGTGTSVTIYLPILC